MVGRSLSSNAGRNQPGTACSNLALRDYESIAVFAVVRPRTCICLRAKVRGVRLYFAKADLLLARDGEQYVLSMGTAVLAKFSHEKKAVAEFNRIRRDLEEKFPPAELSDSDRRAAYQEFVSKFMIGRNLSDKKQKPNKSRTFG